MVYSCSWPVYQTYAGMTLKLIFERQEIVLLRAGAGGGFVRHGRSGVEAGGGMVEHGLPGRQVGRE
ncbi:hypothetical protein E2C01_041571 [Portunus trituberculatus]|uniref:Uncharacterized protein n=1 Tax=Portunus trituberculatus TaxID=210409 RepID=A0A5B7FS19_PORTR|nr:hypothetical protein [Portunus trituberculatus]